MKIDSVKFNKIVQTLIETAESSKMYHRHACALMCGGKILFKNVNTQDRFSKHAEMNVIDACLEKGIPPNAFLIVLGITRSGRIHESKPCSECLKYIKKYRVKRVCYSNFNGDFIVEKTYKIYTEYKTLYYRMLDNKTVFPK